MKLRNVAVGASLSLLFSLIFPLTPSVVSASGQNEAVFNATLLGANGALLTNATLQISNADNYEFVKSAEPSSPGASFNFTLSPGVYEAKVIPFNDLGAGPESAITSSAWTAYTISVSSDASQVEVDSELLALSDGQYAFAFEAAASNLFGRVVDNQGVPFEQDWDAERWVDVSLQRWVEENGSSSWQSSGTGRAYVMQNGFFALRAEVTGLYRVKLEPFGYENYANTTLEAFTVSDLAEIINLGLELTPGAGNLFGNVLAGGAPFAGAWVEPILETDPPTQLGDQGVSSRVDGSWAMNLSEDGSYSFVAKVWQNNEYVDSSKSPILVIEGGEPVTFNGEPVTSETRINLELRAPNTEITVTAGGAPAKDVWVNLNQQGADWLGGAMTDANGVARLFLEESQAESAIQIMADVNSNPSLRTSYASRTASLDSGLTLSGSKYTYTLALLEPNLKLQIFDPNGSAVRDSWVELIDRSSGQWVQGGNTNRFGQLAMAVDLPNSGEREYDLRVNPSFNSSALFSSNTYLLTATPSGLSVAGSNGVELQTSSVAGFGAAFNLSLLAPNVRGTVFASASSQVKVRDSGVVAINPQTDEYLWNRADWTDSQGGFAMNLANGTYQLQAQAPWNSGGMSPSQRCNFDIVNGVIDLNMAGSCQADGDGQIRLELREANLKFTLVDSTNAPVEYANVGVGLGSWFTWGQSNSEGDVGLFIDSDEIAQRNGLTDSDVVTLSFWVDPPFGNSDLVRWDCQVGDSEPLCDQLTSFTVADGFSEVDLQTPIQFQSANTQVQVVYPNSTSPLAGAWVSLFVDIDVPGCTGCREWLGGGTSDQDGIVGFYVDTESASISYSVEVNAPWNQRDDFSQKLTFAATFTDLVTSTFAPGIPNLRVIATAASQSMRWGWVGVEEVLANGDRNWITGVGLDDNGAASLTIPEGVTTSITVYPGPFSSAVPTSCLVVNDGGAISEVDGSCTLGSIDLSEDVASLDLTMSFGNVSGVVRLSNNPQLPAAGALIVASSSSGIVTATSDSSGRFSMELGAGDWEFTVVYVRKPEDSAEYFVTDPNSISWSESMTVDAVSNSFEFEIGE